MLDMKMKHEIEEETKRKERLAQEMKEREQKHIELTKNINGIEAEIEQLDRELLNYLALLERPMKKFKRTIIDKQKSKIIEEFLSSPLETYIGSANNENELRQVFDELRTSIIKGTIENDKKLIEKTVQAIEKLMQNSSINSATRISELRREMEEHESEVQKIIDQNRESEKVLREFERKNQEIQKNAKLKEEIELKSNKIVEEIERLSQDFIGRKIKLKESQ
ncbi:MAG: hypothetical protein NT039_04695 [Candidatus Berkelbacteria bacterium]|nr:hypothetical protein [Candidatus Berkelbacteria bacterium]